MNATEDRTRYLKNEIAAFESRLTAVKSEIDALKGQKEALAGEIDSRKADFNRTYDAKVDEMTKQRQDIGLLREKLETDQASFKKMLEEFQREKGQVDTERASLVSQKKDAQMTVERAVQFIRLVQKAATEL